MRMSVVWKANVMNASFFFAVILASIEVEVISNGFSTFVNSFLIFHTCMLYIASQPPFRHIVEESSNYISILQGPIAYSLYLSRNDELFFNR